MANSCCQESYTECNKIVTIAYLKSFVGNNIQNTTNGSAMSVNSSDDNYCPTYGELVGGNLVQNHVAAASGRWSDDVDGITVGGSYADNECVRQEDLSLTYTRFKSLTSSVGKTTFSECGDSTNLTYVYTLTRTKKSMNPNCTVDTVSSDGTDTNNNKITNTSSNAAFTVTKTAVSAGKNGSISAPSRSTVISTKITFRGTTHSATNITITQNALTGDYVHHESYYDETTGVTASPTTSTSFDCDGGSYGASAVYYYDAHEIRSWVDSCGTNYPSVTRDFILSTGNSADLGSDGGSFDYIDCCIGGSDSDTLSFSKDGYSDSVSFYQECEQDDSCCEVPGCELDECYDYRDYHNAGDCSPSPEYETVNCDVTSYVVPRQDPNSYYIYDLKKPLPSGCSEDCDDPKFIDVCWKHYAGGEVNFPANTGDSSVMISGTVGGITYYITQRACPSCKCEPTYSLKGTYSAPASGGTVTITWNKTYAATCSTACTSGTVTADVNIGCNSGASRTVTGTHETYGDWTVSQASGTPATCGSMCECYSASTPATVTATSYSATSAEVSWKYKIRSSNGTWGAEQNTATTVTFAANTGNTNVNRTGTYRMTNCKSCNGNDCGPDLTVNWTVVVPGKACTCADAAPTGTTAITMPQSGGTYQFTYSNCVGGVRWNSGLASLDEGTRTFTITLGENDTTSAKTYNIVFTYYLESNFTTTCGTYTVEITQAGKFECPEYEIMSEVPELDWQGGTKKFNPIKKNG